MNAQILSLITPALAMIFALAFGVLWRRDRTQLHLLAFAFAYAMLVSSFVLVIAVLDGRQWQTLLTVHLLSSSGGIALMWGAAVRLGQRSPLFAYAAIVAVSLVILFFACLREDASLMRLTQNASASLIFALGALVLWQAGPRSMLDRALIWTTALFAAHGFLRPITASLIEGDLETLAFGQSDFQAINVLMVGVLSVLMALLLIALSVRDQVDAEREMATRDALTGLNNRSAFEEEAQMMLARARAHGNSVCLIVSDIDNFKRINDTFGHSGGDRVIEAFSRVIQGGIRPSDLAGRIGGEEFGLAVWNCAEQDARSLAERLCGTFAATKHPELRAGERVTASFGVAQWQPGEDYALWFKRADTALYNAKNSGRNRVATSVQPHHRPDDTPAQAATSQAAGRDAPVVDLAIRQAERTA